jgi:hypothetical protein
MTTYAAYDDCSIYALGHTEKAAIKNARNDTKEPEAEFLTAPVSDELAAYIETNGWNGSLRSFEIDQKTGFIVDTTDD